MSYTNSVVLPISPQEAFALVTEPERLRRWQAISAVVDLRAGGEYRWTITPGHIAAGTFREIEPGRRLVIGWGWEGDENLPPEASTVTLTMEPDQDGATRVTLVHQGLTEEQLTAHAEGWNHYLERLELLAGTGDAGPDEWVSAPDILTPTIAAEASLAAIQPVLRGLTTQDRPKPTPCTEFTCHELVEHLFGSLTALGAMAGADVPVPDGPLEGRVSIMVGRVVDAWRAHGSEGMVTVPGGKTMPASLAEIIVPLEVALHGWDLAQGSGQVMVLSDEVVEYLRGLAEQVVPGGRGTAFADEVLPGHSGSALDRLAAYTGRSPLF